MVTSADVGVKVHMAEYSALQDQRKQDRQAVQKRKYEEKRKKTEVKKQRKDELALRMTRLATFNSRVGEDLANDVFTEAVTDLRSESEELQEEHAAAEQHLQLLIHPSKPDQNPMYVRTRDRVAHLKDELKQIIKPKQSYYSPPPAPARLSKIFQPQVPSSPRSHLLRQRPPLRNFSNEQLEQLKQQNEAENQYVSHSYFPLIL